MPFSVDLVTRTIIIIFFSIGSRNNIISFYKVWDLKTKKKKLKKHILIGRHLYMLKITSFVSIWNISMTSVALERSLCKIYAFLKNKKIALNLIFHFKVILLGTSRIEF